MTKLRIFMLDCGRKYFSKEEIKEIILSLGKLNYTHIQLLFANNGFRFFLDDMEVFEFDSESVKNSLVKGNLDYGKRMKIPRDYGKYLIQSEMDEIISFARENGIEVMAGLNVPGHMDSLVYAIEDLGIKDAKFKYKDKISDTTVDLNNHEAIEFVKVLVKKYVDYFSSKGIEYFNFGADEYANIITECRGYEILIENGDYQKFLDLGNYFADYILSKGMKPICFSDGVYYNENTNYHFNKEVIIALWTKGWDHYFVAQGKTFIEKGHELLNVNDKWYYVLGSEDEDLCNRQGALANINGDEKFDVTVGERVDSIGSMICLWCDFPDKKYEFEKLEEVLAAFSENNSEYFNKQT